ncbi:toprim domain-containing protein [Prosthecobacter sp.]|uniref:toprim domain-containing protein n=1 Tax=Prosthecobacter sp. TaxID=1965333 RepID=UPI002488B845|nr:toprim domain-containing protein [Prosthecobacter sp.]MDI1313513.1 toprim domain-containing protein [Prosthecobacter sp.]
MKIDLQKLDRLRERGGKLIARCPACHEIGSDTAGDNLAIFDNGNFACAAYQQDREHSKRILELVGLPQQRQADCQPSFAPSHSLPRPKPQETPLPRPTPRQVSMVHTLARTLADSVQRCHELAAARQWKDLTVRNAALDLCLGWARFGPALKKPDVVCPDEALCFLYPAGVKVRFPTSGSGKNFRWLKGEGMNVQSLWRLDAITDETAIVWITEGEPDALRLMDLGIGEDRSTHEAVCALPSASYQLSMQELDRLRCRQIIFCPDNDAAGQQATARLAKSLQSISLQLQIRPIQ